MSDSPERILQFVKHPSFKDLEGDIIAFINVKKLRAMKVLFNRTTTLAERLGIEAWARSRQRGISYINRNYWVAYRWVPAECIELYISVQSLRNTFTKQKTQSTFSLGILSFDDIVILPSSSGTSLHMDTLA
jgi:hypothetical protein